MSEAVEKVLDAKVSPGGPGYVYVLPRVKLSAKTRPIRKRDFDPIAAAEVQMKRVSAQYSYWLEEQESALRKAHRAFKKNPKDPVLYETLKAIIHEIKGNAPLLGSSAAGALACPMATAMERCTGNRIVHATFDLVVTAICSALRGKISENDHAFVDLIATLDEMNAKCASNDLQSGAKARSGSG